MSVNKQRPHLLILPEDDANRQLANGFILHQRLLSNRIQVIPPLGGWARLLRRFKSDYLSGLEIYSARFLVLLIDFDGSPNRMARVREQIPVHLADRVFVLGAWTEPEDLRRASLGSYEEIGLALASNCLEDTLTIWKHDLLRCNLTEFCRLRRCVRPFLWKI